jgi:hypothetical protein
VTPERKRLLMVAAVHVPSYPVLVWLVWVWFGIAESSPMELLGSVLLGLMIIVAIAWLLATAFTGGLRVTVSTWARSLVFVVACLLLLGGTLWLGGSRRLHPVMFWTASAALIAVLLPLHFVRTLRLLRDWRYWAACMLLVVIGAYAPWKLVSWVPAAKTLTAQAASLTIRFAAAYLFAVASFLVFAFVVRRLAADQISPTPAA